MIDATLPTTRPSASMMIQVFLMSLGVAEKVFMASGLGSEDRRF